MGVHHVKYLRADGEVMVGGGTGRIATIRIGWTTTGFGSA